MQGREDCTGLRSEFERVAGELKARLEHFAGECFEQDREEVVAAAGHDSGHEKAIDLRSIGPREHPADGGRYSFSRFERDHQIPQAEEHDLVIGGGERIEHRLDVADGQPGEAPDALGGDFGRLGAGRAQDMGGKGDRVSQRAEQVGGSQRGLGIHGVGIDPGKHRRGPEGGGLRVKHAKEREPRRADNLTVSIQRAFDAGGSGLRELQIVASAQVPEDAEHFDAHRATGIAAAEVLFEPGVEGAQEAVVVETRIFSERPQCGNEELGVGFFGKDFAGEVARGNRVVTERAEAVELAPDLGGGSGTPFHEAHCTARCAR